MCNFKESFKYYKSKIPIPDFADVIDLNDDKTINLKCSELDLINDELTETIPPGLQPVHKWRGYRLNEHPGLIIIRSPFTIQAQRYWIARCLRDYPKQPNLVNLNERLFSSKVLENWWRELQLCEDANERRRIKISMRWATLGYHHDWDSKVYSEEMKTAFPTDLAAICNFFASILGFEKFKAEAAIVNYYPIGTTLAGHTDHSEKNLEAPLFSFSFGQTAIFLIGGSTKEQKPTAIFLKSGDVLVMSRESRVCYHAVPRIMKATEELWNLPTPKEKDNSPQTSPTLKKLKTDVDYMIQQNGHQLDSNYDARLYDQVQDESFWEPFRSYLNDSRININVRQVLNDGATSL